MKLFSGSCHGRFLGTQVAANATECLRMCGVNPNCEWFTYDAGRGRCVFTDSCFPIDSGNSNGDSSSGFSNNNNDVVSGRKECAEKSSPPGNTGTAPPQQDTDSK